VPSTSDRALGALLRSDLSLLTALAVLALELSDFSGSDTDGSSGGMSDGRDNSSDSKTSVLTT
jgi:hypothetical protein